MALIFDIETVGQDFDGLDAVTKDNLTRWIRRQAGDDADKYRANLADLKEGLGFSPLTGEIAAIGVYDEARDRGVVYFQAPATEESEYREANFVFKPRTEAGMLEEFWRGASAYREFVSFNGRSFDAPWLAIRSAVHRLRPTRDLMARRYYQKNISGVSHLDLLDQFTFYGAVRRRGSLHLYCRAFGIHSPKAGGITGDDVARLFRERKYRAIAEYNSWDLVATAELYRRWKKYFLV